MNLNLPELSLVVLIGVSGSGKSTFARTHFKPTEVLSSDFCRALVSDDENNQTATDDAFDVLHYLAGKRLARGLLTVVDATNVQAPDRKPLIELARAHDVLPVAIVLDLPLSVCKARNRARPDRDFGTHVIPRQHRALQQSLRNLKREGFRHVFLLKSEEDLANVALTRTRLWNNRKDEHGPFDLIGDVHGCFEELTALLTKLGYHLDSPVPDTFHVTPPAGRKAIFLGDLVDRGPDSPSVLRLVMGMVAEGTALCIPGNHDDKLKRKLQGRDVRIAHGLAETLAQLEGETPEFKTRVAAFIDGLVSHYVLNDGKLVVAHAGMKEAYQGRASSRVRDFALYGETTGETDEFGLPVRYPWAEDYRGRALVVYGHTPIPEPEWLNHTINLDTGCVFGGKLTALRYPEKELISVPASRTYSEPARPFLPPEEAAPPATPPRPHDILDLSDVSGKRILDTRLQRKIVLQANQTAAALEVMSRFAANPRWLIYLPPTMSPSETSSAPEWLEHPTQAFDYYRANGVLQVVCEEKHMGSRAVVVVCRDMATAHRRFGIGENEAGIVYTRTGRRFFDEMKLEGAFLARLREALTRAEWWDTFQSDWFCLDCELLPWSAKAQQLLEDQYAAVGTAAEVGLREAVTALELATRSNLDANALLTHFQQRADNVTHYRQVYRQYCWPVQSLTDLKLAPFHLLASEGGTYFDQDHVWQMQTLHQLCATDPDFLLATEYHLVEVTNTESVQAGINWWGTLTGRGGEGMVVKPFSFIAQNAKGLLQPAVKCRGREYLRLIYGPEYTAPEHLARLRGRGLGKKRSLALREFALGVEGLERFVRQEPLYRVHECVFGVLALESDPVDPRL
ncbi:MAG: polynucleotide kinase-phosphatase [Anaerolineales bacterium]|nr:polynucleotide kinase-phosphatase [Anaerolineales bacterium]